MKTGQSLQSAQRKKSRKRNALGQFVNEVIDRDVESNNLGPSNHSANHLPVGMVDSKLCETLKVEQVVDTSTDLHLLKESGSVSYSGKSSGSGDDIQTSQYESLKEPEPETTILPLSEAALIIKLDQNFSLDKEQGHLFENLDNIQRRLLLLTWPLPSLNESDLSKIKAKANITKSRRIPLDKKIIVDDYKFDVGITTFYHLLKYNIHLTDKNQMNRQQFVKEYVKEYLKSAKLDIESASLTAQCQNLQVKVVNENKVEVALKATLYDVCRPLVEATLEDLKGDISLEFMDILKERKYLKKIETGKQPFDLTSEMEPDIKANTSFFGINQIPDLQVGYFKTFESPLSNTYPVYLSNLAEVKYVTFNLKDSVKELINLKKWRFSKKSLKEEGKPDFEIDELMESQSIIREVQNTIQKYTTLSIHLGNNRYLLSDYRGFLFVSLHFEKEESTEGYGVSSAENGDHIRSRYAFFEFTEPNIRLIFTSFFLFTKKLKKELDAFRKLVNKQLVTTRDEVAQAGNIPAASETGNQGKSSEGEQLAQGKPDAGNPSTVKEEEHIGDKMVGKQKVEEKETRTPTMSSSSDSTNSSEPKTPQAGELQLSADNKVYSMANRKIDVTSEGLLKIPEDEIMKIPENEFSQAFKFNKFFFKNVSCVELGHIITDLVQFGERISQVVKIDSFKFRDQVGVERFCLKDELLPPFSILKVFDCNLGAILETDDFPEESDEVYYNYQNCIDFTVQEAKCYCLLSEYSGDFIPRMFSYGRLTDLYPKVGEMYFRLFGGYIMMELLTNYRHQVITREYFEKTIVVLFEKMHGRNVIHNDIKSENFIYTENGEFKVIDFSHAIISEDEKEKETEMDLLYEFFEYSRPN